MTHEEHHLGEDLAAMAEGGTSLDADRRAELQRHVATCDACKSAIAGCRLVFRAMAETPRVEPSNLFDERLFARLDAIDRGGSSAASEGAFRPTLGALVHRVAAFFTLPRVGLAAAAATLGVVFLLSVQPKIERTVPDPVMHEVARDLATDPTSLELAEHLELAENLELLRDYEIIEDLDALEELDLIEGMDDAEAG